jgi:tetratricopeptide (TPR) repeat protein
LPATDRKQFGANEAEVQRRAKAHALYATAVVQELNQDTDSALKSFSEAVRLDPDNEQLLLDVSRRLLQNKMPEKAVGVLERTAAREAASAQLLTQLGYAYSQVGQKERAVVMFQRAVKAAPSFFPAHQQLFVHRLQAKQIPDAKSALDLAARQEELPAEFLLGLAELYLGLSIQAPDLQRESHTNAMALLVRAESLKPEEIPLRLALADHLNALGESQRAAQIYLQVLKELPFGADLRDRLHARLSEIYLRNNDAERANEQLEAIVRSDPTNPQAHYFLGVIAMEMKQPLKAIDYFQRTIILKPEFEQGYFDLANAQLSADKPTDALSTLAQVRQVFRPSFLLEYLTAIAHTRQKAYKEALSHYTAAEVIARATEPARMNQFFYFQFGAASERNGDFQQAEILFEKALELAPDFPEAQNYLGYMWAERGINLERAKDLIAKALKAEPENDAFLDSMGWVLFQMNQPQEALTFLLKAAELAEEPDPTVYDHLGDVYSALGETEKANEAWRKSLSIEESEQVRKKLELRSAR